MVHLSRIVMANGRGQLVFFHELSGNIAFVTQLLHLSNMGYGFQLFPQRQHTAVARTSFNDAHGKICALKDEYSIGDWRATERYHTREQPVVELRERMVPIAPSPRTDKVLLVTT